MEQPKVTPAIPAVVSKRNEFSPADELVENEMLFVPDEYKHEKFRAWLTHYTEGVIKKVSHHFAVGARRGIEQAAELLCDPAFYETRRQKRSAWFKQQREQCDKQEQERIERITCPTAEQLTQQIKWSEDQVAYHQRQLEIYSENLAKLRALSPKNIRIVPKARG